MQKGIIYKVLRLIKNYELVIGNSQIGPINHADSNYFILINNLDYLLI